MILIHPAFSMERSGRERLDTGLGGMIFIHHTEFIFPTTTRDHRYATLVHILCL